jgi:hypothetical protein
VDGMDSGKNQEGIHLGKEAVKKDSLFFYPTLFIALIAFLMAKDTKWMIFNDRFYS